MSPSSRVVDIPLNLLNLGYEKNLSPSDMANKLQSMDELSGFQITWLIETLNQDVTCLVPLTVLEVVHHASHTLQTSGVTAELKLTYGSHLSPTSL